MVAGPEDASLTPAGRPLVQEQLLFVGLYLDTSKYHLAQHLPNTGLMECAETTPTFFTSYQYYQYYANSE
jgi:hypothetical protein